MVKLILSDISLADIKQLVKLREKTGTEHEWNQVEAIALTENEQRQVQDIRSRLIHTQVHLFNEATVWLRAIYPLLLLAERNSIQAWAGVMLQTRYPTFEIDGIADGVLGKSLAGRIETPYLIVLETKRGVEAQSPIFQLYGQLLAAAHLNWENNQQDPQEIFGCYTIADSWTFLRAEVEGLDSDRPSLQVEYSREYTEKIDAELILKILKGIVARYLE